jgi:hypothetical protein
MACILKGKEVKIRQGKRQGCKCTKRQLKITKNPTLGEV